MATIPRIYQDIDWASLRANAFADKGWKSKSANDWDKKARSFAGRNKTNSYIDHFISHLPLQPEMTVLDIGCGPGTLAIPIAQKVSSVTALDFSSGMLTTLQKLADEANLTNISTVQAAWEDNWHDLKVSSHDIAIASRSMAVKDLEMAINKINSFATKYVFISDRIGPTPFEVGAFEALGREFSPGPDYIYTLNSLYSMGIYPNVSVITLEQDTTFSTFAEAVASFKWMFNDLNQEEEFSLNKFVKRRIIDKTEDTIVIRRQTPPKWAIIWWAK